METEPPKRKRRRFQFRLRTLMIGVTLLAVACGYVGWQAKIVRQRCASSLNYSSGFANCVKIVACGDPTKAPNLLRRWLGDVASDAVALRPNSTTDDIRAAAELFPEAVIALTDKGDLVGEDGDFFHLRCPVSFRDARSNTQRLKRSIPDRHN